MSIRTFYKSALILAFVLTVLGSTLTPVLALAPTNDDFDSAVVVGGLPFSTSLSAADATAANDDPTTCTNTGSVWFAFTPSADMTLDANTFGSNYDTVLSIYTGSRGALEQVFNACNDDSGSSQSRIVFQALANTTYYFLVGTCCGFGGNGSGDLVFNLQELPFVVNDDFADATPILMIPYGDVFDASRVSLEPSEPNLSCMFNVRGTAWYSYTPTTDGYISANSGSYFAGVAVYTGNELSTLTQLGCVDFSYVTIQAQAGTTYYFQVGIPSWIESGQAHFTLNLPPPPEVDISPTFNPSTYEPTGFYAFVYDPAKIGIASYLWDFADGTTSNEESPQHQYTADGDYFAQVTVTTFDGRSTTRGREIRVRTHDVAITKLTVPQAARAGQTRQIVVHVTTKRYDEQVEVYLFKSVARGVNQVGSPISLAVPVQPGKRTVDFSFNYTFTEADAHIGKVTFTAQAFAQSNFGTDAFEADNLARSAPIKVSRGQVQGQREGEQGGSVYLPVVVR